MLADRMYSVILAMFFFAPPGCGLSISTTGVAEPAKTRHAAAAPGSVDLKRLSQSGLEAGQWFTPGRDAGGTYYSPLSRINANSVAGLGFAWQYTLGTTCRLTQF